MTNEDTDFTDTRMFRKKAEELATINNQNEFLHENNIDKTKLLYELQVHQIELELQNQALRQANSMAEAALKKYTMLFDLAAMGYFLLEPDGKINELNFTGADMLREKRFSLKGTNFKLFVSDESKKLFNDFFKKMMAGNSKESCTIFLGYDGNQLCKVYIEGIVTENELYLLSVVNLSILKKTE